MEGTLRICWPEIVEMEQFYRSHGIVKRARVLILDPVFNLLCNER